MESGNFERTSAGARYAEALEVKDSPHDRARNPGGRAAHQVPGYPRFPL